MKNYQTVKSLYATHELNETVIGFLINIGAAIDEIDVPGEDWNRRIGVGAPIPSAERAGEIIAVDGWGRASVMDDGEQFAAGG